MQDRIKRERMTLSERRKYHLTKAVECGNFRYDDKTASTARHGIPENQRARAWLGYSKMKIFLKHAKNGVQDTMQTSYEKLLVAHSAKHSPILSILQLDIQNYENSMMRENESRESR